MGWDRLLWEAGSGTSNRKNNHFWDVRTITCLSSSFNLRLRAAEVFFESYPTFALLPFAGLAHSATVTCRMLLLCRHFNIDSHHALSFYLLVRISIHQLKTQRIFTCALALFGLLPLLFVAFAAVNIVLITLFIMSVASAQQSAAKPSSGAVSTSDKWPSWYGHSSQCFRQRQLELTTSVVSTSKKQ